MHRSYKGLLKVFIVLIFLGLAGMIGHMLARNEPRIVEPKPERTAAAAGVHNARISSDAHVEWTYKYSMCRHQTNETRPVGESMVGLSFSQFKKKFPDVRIISFDARELVLEKSFGCYCPSHFILKKSGNVLAVFRTRSGTNEQENIRIIDTKFEDVGPDEREPLILGKVFSTMKEIDEYIIKVTQNAE